MMKRFSTLRRKKDDGGAVGENGTNGYGYGSSATAAAKPAASTTANGVNGTSQAKKRFSFGPGKKLDQPAEATATREDVDHSLEEFAQLVQASRRPLPTQTGDGTYISGGEVPSSLLQDIKSLGFKDVKTLQEVLKNKGELQDDKTMLMERVIQVKLS